MTPSLVQKNLGLFEPGCEEWNIKIKQKSICMCLCNKKKTKMFKTHHLCEIIILPFYLRSERSSMNVKVPMV